MKNPNAFFYPGRRVDYVFQALRFTSVVMCGLIGLYALVLGVDVFLLGERHVGSGQFFLILAMGGFIGLISIMMATSLSRFGIITSEQTFTVHRGARELMIPYKMVMAVDRVRIPGWWPLRADLKPRRETARNMIRINVKGKRPLTFVSGLEGEKELLDTVRKAAGLSQQ